MSHWPSQLVHQIPFLLLHVWHTFQISERLDKNCGWYRGRKVCADTRTHTRTDAHSHIGTTERDRQTYIHQTKNDIISAKASSFAHELPVGRYWSAKAICEILDRLLCYELYSYNAHSSRHQWRSTRRQTSDVHVFVHHDTVVHRSGTLATPCTCPLDVGWQARQHHHHHTAAAAAESRHSPLFARSRASC